METWLYLAVGLVFFGSIAIYLIVMFLWPEWVGITGKTAIKNEESHRSGQLEKDEDFIAKLHEKKSEDQKN